MAEADRLEDPINHKRDHWKGRFMGQRVAFEAPADVQVEVVFEDVGMWAWRLGERLREWVSQEPWRRATLQRWVKKKKPAKGQEQGTKDSEGGAVLGAKGKDLSNGR